MKIEDNFQVNQLIFDKLHQSIQLWTNSDEFVDSLVFISQEFTLTNTTPLIEAIFGLLLKTIKPEEFKANLLASLPPDRQNEAIVSKLVHASLLPVKGPLAESGIDISIITPLDETFSSPYIPPAPETTTEIVTSEHLSAPLDEVVIPPAIAPEILTNSVASEFSATLLNTDPVSSYSSTPFQSTPSETNTSDPALISTDTPPISPNTPPASSDIMPISPVEIAPLFSSLPDASIEPISTNEQISTNDSLPTSTPFVIHQEKPIERTSQDPQYKEELLKPLFYSKKEERRDPPSFVNLEFGPPMSNDNTNP